MNCKLVVRLEWTPLSSKCLQLGGTTNHVSNDLWTPFTYFVMGFVTMLMLMYRNA
jgi:hypothetical protein